MPTEIQKLLRFLDEVEAINFYPLLNQTQKNIISLVKSSGGSMTQAELKKYFRGNEDAMIRNVKKLEKAHILKSYRSAIKVFVLNYSLRKRRETFDKVRHILSSNNEA